MNIYKEKKNVFGEIAALRVSAESYPKKLLNSIPSININANTLNFLLDLLKSLVGFDALNDALVETLTQNLEEIEYQVKLTLKKALKNMVSCSINPKIPDWFINEGVVLEVSKIDFLDIMRVDPTTKAGKLIYEDVASGTLSTDFNTFLYNTIQDNGGISNWGAVTTGTDILGIQFNASGATIDDPNNSIIVKTSATYPSTKKLTDLNNDYIDSVTLFSSPKMINNIVDSIFGLISLEVSKDKKTIERELLINDIIDRIINSDDDVIIDDSYFSFSNEDYADIEYRANLKSIGINKVQTSEDVDSSIRIDTLVSLNDELEQLLGETPSGVLNENITTLVRNGINNLADEAAQGADEKDKLSIKFNFMENMLKKLMLAIVNVILSPKLILIFAMNHKIIHDEVFEDPEDFLRKNKWLITVVLESVRDMIIDILLAKVLKEVKKLALDNFIKTQTEKIKAKKAQLASLTGVPNEILRKISGLTKT